MTISYRQVSSPFKGCRRGCSPRHIAHNRSIPGVDYLSLSPLENPAGSTKRTQTMQATETPPLTDGFTASQVYPHIYMMQTSFILFSMHMTNGRPESIVTPLRQHGLRY